MAKILLVEDDNNLREIYEARLQAEGYDIAAAKDGEEALVKAKQEKPDLIISDVMMPRISGFEMLDILRNTEGLKEAKVIMLTALGQAEDKTRADSLGADRYLVKSQVTLEDIVKAADELLNGGVVPAAEPAAAPTATPAPVAMAMATPPPEPGSAPAAPATTVEPQPTAIPAPAATVPSPAAAVPAAPISVPATPTVPSTPAAPASIAPTPAAPAIPVTQPPATSTPVEPVISMPTTPATTPAPTSVTATPPAAPHDTPAPAPVAPTAAASAPTPGTPPVHTVQPSAPAADEAATPQAPVVTPHAPPVATEPVPATPSAVDNVAADDKLIADAVKNLTETLKNEPAVPPAAPQAPPAAPETPAKPPVPSIEATAPEAEAQTSPEPVAQTPETPAAPAALPAVESASKPADTPAAPAETAPRPSILDAPVHIPEPPRPEPTSAPALIPDEPEEAPVPTPETNTPPESEPAQTNPVPTPEHTAAVVASKPDTIPEPPADTQHTEPEPAPTFTTPPAVDGASSAADEQALMEAQIDDFINHQGTAPAEPVEPTVIAPGADASPPAASDAEEAAQPLTDQEAVEQLPDLSESPKGTVITGGSPLLGATPTDHPAAEPTVVAPAAPVAPRPNATDEQTNDDPVSIAHKKVIQPPVEPIQTQPDLSELLAKEGISSLDEDEEEHEQAVPTNNVPHQPGHVISPNGTNGTPPPAGLNPTDPNNIAL